MKILFFIFLLFFSSISSSEAFTRSNFETPESFVIDPADGSYYVSNIVGGPLDKDANGYISKINHNGNIVIQKFIESKKSRATLDAPKGLLVKNNELWVTDIDTVHIFNKKTAKLIRNLDFSVFSAKFLNDIALGTDEKVFVSDMFTDQIFLVDAKNSHSISVYKSGSQLGNPNGLLFNPKTKSLMVVTFKSGQVLEIDRQKKIHVLKRGLTSLDGIDYDNEGSLFVSSFEKGEIYRIPFMGRGSLSTFMGELITPADISCDRKNNELLIPSFKGNTVTTVFLYDNKPKK